MIHLLRRLPLLLLALLPLRLHALDVLFVGNSFTVWPLNQTYGPVTDVKGTGYTGGVPSIFKKFTMEAGIPNINVSVLGAGGASLTNHLTNDGPVFDQPWDVVVLQDYSTRPSNFGGGNGIAAGNIPAFRASVEALRNRILQANPNTKIYLYETWARGDLVNYGHYPDLEAMQNELRTAYAEAASDFGLHGWVPVGDAFMKALADGVAYGPNQAAVPGLVKLYANDRYHADPPGSFLSAMLFFNRILGGDPRTLPTGQGSAAQMLSINPTHAAQLQAIAWEMNQNVPIVRHPDSRAATIGGHASFFVGAAGYVTSYQWRFNGAPIPGATSSVLSVSPVSAADIGRYDVVVTWSNGNSETSRPASLALATSSTDRTFFIDFGPADSGYPTPSPAGGPHWNNLHAVTTGAGLTQLRDSQGAVHPTARLTITKPFTRTSTSGLNAAGPYPATAQRDSIFVTGDGALAGSGHGELSFTDLHPQAQYRFKIFASREGAGNRTARYLIGDLPPLHLSAVNNTSNTVESVFVSPAPDSSIALQVLPRDAAGALQEYGFLGVVELTESIAVASAFAHWSALSGVPASQSAPTDDPDGDSLPNLLEYALGLDPLVANPTSSPVATTFDHEGQSYLSLLVPRSPDAQNVDLTVEVSSDLVTWHSGGAHTTAIVSSPDFLLVRDNTPVSAASRRFIRVRATQTP